MGRRSVLPGYYACVGTMPCADTEYYLLVRWEHREAGRQGERRVVLPEHIRVLDPAVVLLPPPHAASLTPVAASGPSVALPEDLVHPTSESTASTKGTGQPEQGALPAITAFLEEEVLKTERGTHPMPKQQELRFRLSEQAKQGLPHRAFSEEELRAFLSTATFDGGRIHRYVESRRRRG